MFMETILLSSLDLRGSRFHPHGLGRGAGHANCKQLLRFLYLPELRWRARRPQFCENSANRLRGPRLAGLGSRPSPGGPERNPSICGSMTELGHQGKAPLPVLNTRSRLGERTFVGPHDKGKVRRKPPPGPSGMHMEGTVQRLVAIRESRLFGRLANVARFLQRSSDSGV
jgi:hypothetical protein